MGPTSTPRLDLAGKSAQGQGGHGRRQARTRWRDDLVTLGLVCAAAALCGLWIVGLVTVVRWVV